jgi:hypothetical protein
LYRRSVSGVSGHARSELNTRDVFESSFGDVGLDFSCIHAGWRVLYLESAQVAQRLRASLPASEVVCAGIQSNSYFDQEARVRDYDPRWPSLFEAENALITEALHTILPISPVLYKIHHIGSTSVPGMRAKAVVDIEINVAFACDFLGETLFLFLFQRGYQVVSVSAKHVLLWKPSSPDAVFFLVTSISLPNCFSRFYV